MTESLFVVATGESSRCGMEEDVLLQWTAVLERFFGSSQNPKP